MKLIVMIPAYNEVNTIGNVIKEIPRDLDGIDSVEVLVINDGSTDKTSEIAKKAGADKVVNHNINKGVGSTFSTGIDNALKMGADIIVNIDADGQFDTNEIPKLINPILKKDYDAVIGSRFLDKNLEPEMPWIKKKGNMFFTKIINRITKMEFTDAQCGFRAFSRQAAIRLILFGDFTYTQETLLSLVRQNQRIIEIPVKVKGRLEGKSKVVKTWYFYGIKAMSIILRSYCDFKPLKVFSAISFLMFLGSLLFLIRVLEYYIQYRMFTGIMGTALLSGFLFSTSITIFTFGILADMFKRKRQILEDVLYYEKLNFYEKEMSK